MIVLHGVVQKQNVHVALLITKMPLIIGRCKYVSPQFVVLNERTYIFSFVDYVLINKWQHNVKCLKRPFNSYGELSHKMSVSDVLVFWSSTIALQTANSTLHFSDYFWYHNILVRIKNHSSDGGSLIMTFSPDEVIWCVHL